MDNYLNKSTEKIHELLGYENIKIIQDDEMFSFSLDSMMLANFVDTKGAKNIIDLGTGNGPIPLFLTLKTDAKIIGVEIQDDVADLAKRSVKLNSFEEQITILNQDFKNIYKEVGANKFDIVTSNPPYFKSNTKVPLDEGKRLARNEQTLFIKDIFIIAKKLLKDCGNIAIVIDTERLVEVLQLMKENSIEPKKIQFVYPKSTKN